MSIAASAPNQPSLTDIEIINDFCADCKLRGMTPETIRRYRSSILIFHEFLVEKRSSLFLVDMDLLRHFLSHLRNERGVKEKTIENYFSAISSLFDYLEFEGYIIKNPVPAMRKRYLRRYKMDGDTDSPRKLISIEEMKMLIDSIIDPRDKAIVTLLAKTGIRRGELISIDIEDINFIEQTITLKPKAKRSNRLVFFDDETAWVLKKWIKAREMYEIADTGNPLFVGEHGKRLQRNGVYTVVTKYAERVGLHHPESERIEDHFSPHCCRHWFTTHLRRAGMKREFIQELRGDRRRDAIDIYDHIDRKELREAYLAHIPTLGV